MELNYRLTCNPWGDRGAVILADYLESNDSLVAQLIVNEGQIAVRFYPDVTQEQVGTTLAKFLHKREQQLYVPNSLARVLTAMGRDVAKTDANGYKSTDLTVKVTKDELPELKRRKLTSVKEGENKIYRLTASYPVAEQDVPKLFEGCETLAQHVVEEAANEPLQRAGNCAISGDLTKHLESMTQSLHIFANKHHNAAVRGYTRGNGYFRASATWRYALALSSTEPAHPFFESRDQGTTLLLPVVDDFTFLRRLHRHLQTQLTDVSRFDASTSSTNLRDLYQNDSYSALVTLLHCLRNPLTITDKKGRIDPIEIPRLTRWLTSQFRRAKNVNFGSFHNIEVDQRLFEYVQPLLHHRGEENITFQVVRDVFSKTKWPNTGIAGRFSRALIESSVPAMKSALWEIYKDQDEFSFYNQKGQPSVLSLFNTFLNYFMEVNTKKTMTPEVRSAAKIMGSRVGRAFPRDLTLLSRIFNIHNADELRDAIKIVLFRLEKAGVDQSRRANVQDDERLYPIKNETFEILLDAINDQTYREISDVFSIFASLNAFNANVGGKTDDQTHQDAQEDKS